MALYNIKTLVFSCDNTFAQSEAAAAMEPFHLVYNPQTKNVAYA